MATGKLKNFCTEMEIPEISKLEVIWSPEISIHGIPWKINVSKKGQGADQGLDVYLHCANKDKSPDWSLWGSASFKLLPFSDDVNPIERYIEPLMFDASGTGYGASSLIKWNDLLNPDKKYVKNDKINLEIKVSAENPNDENRCHLNFKCLQKCCGNSHFAQFRLTVKNFVNLMAVQSPQFKLRRLPWHLQISKMRSSDLGVMLMLNKNYDGELSKMKMTVKLISSKKDVQPIQKCITKQYEYLKDLTPLQIVSWAELIKPENGFVNDDSITLEIEIDNEKLNGEASKSNPKTEAKLLQLECAICLENMDGQDISATPCGHLFCLACITKVVEDLAICPTCKTPVQLDALRQLYLPTVN